MENSFTRTLHGETHNSIPLWYMRQAGRYLSQYMELRKKMSILELCHNPVAASEISYVAARETHADAAIIFSDISIPLEGRGYDLKFEEGRGPVFTTNPTRDEREKHPAADAIKEFKKTHGDMPIIGFTGGPFTLFSYLSGEKKEDAKIKLLKDTEHSMKTLHEISRILEEDAIAQVESGADAIQIFDSWIGMLGKEMADKIIREVVSPMIRTIKSRGTPMIYFSTGTSGFFSVLKNTNADFISMDWAVPISEFAGNGIGLQGNLDPDMVKHSPEMAVKEARKMAESMKEHEKYIFNLGHGILPGTDVQTIREISDAVKKVKL
jgi:uroporphyrinogen decarboxylase